MTNPEVVHKKTPFGGDYSEFYLLDKNGNLVDSKEDAYQFRLLERLNDGTIVNELSGPV